MLASSTYKVIFVHLKIPPCPPLSSGVFGSSSPLIKGVRGISSTSNPLFQSLVHL
ncbi:MAG: hypothetical protein LBC61_05450 [Candidatus Peribacteria bacterium]|nr:hypothetical protein [Candidatus Peribacteria bacterium]